MSSVPMIGQWSVKVIDVRPFTIHGDLYYELTIQRVEDANSLSVLRLAQHTCQNQPEAGDELVLSFLMGQVTEARKI